MQSTASAAVMDVVPGESSALFSGFIRLYSLKPVYTVMGQTTVISILSPNSILKLSKKPLTANFEAE